MVCVSLQTHKLSEQEESEIRECFALFDRDKDGKIKVICRFDCVDRIRTDEMRLAEIRLFSIKVLHRVASS